jgi:sugar-phosphatase
MRFWPQALVFELEGMLVEKDSDPARPTHGASALLESLSGKPWGVVATISVEDARNRLSEVGLPNPRVLASAADLEDGTAFREVVEALGVEATETVAFAATPAAMIGADVCGMQIIHPHRIRPPVPTSAWIVDLAQIYHDIRAGQWAVTIAG